MVSFFNSRLSIAIGIILAFLAVIISYYQISGTREIFALQNELIQSDAGCSYRVDINKKPISWPFTEFLADSENETRASNLIFLRNGQSFGHAHAIHDEIRKIGNGNYSHWGKTLYFSMPDCTDPRRIVSAYSVSILPTYTLTVQIILIFCIVYIGVLIKIRSINHPLYLKLMYKVSSLLKKITYPTEYWINNTGGVVLFSVLIMAALFCFLYTWSIGNSVSLAIAGNYQISDSMAYWMCANSLLDMGNFGNAGSLTSDWCQRRSIYPVLLSGITWLGGHNIHKTLLLQSALVCFSILLVVRRASQYVGMLGIATIVILLFLYARQELLFLTMTENAGLIFGCLGFSILINSANNKSLLWISLGIAMMSIALNARSGAFLIMPCIIAWATILAYKSSKNAYVWFVVSLLSACAGFILQAIILKIVGGNSTNSHGNFSYALYALSVGVGNWQQVLIDHPELMVLPDANKSKEIFYYAWYNIKSAPNIFVAKIIDNLILFLNLGSYDYDRLGAMSAFCKACWWMAWIPLIKRFRDPFYSLVTFASLGIIISSPFLIGFGGARIFAATVSIDILQISIGLIWVLSFFNYSISSFNAKKANPSGLRIKNNAYTLEFLLVCILGILIVMPFLKKDMVHHAKSDTSRCNANEYEVLTNFGGSYSMMLDVNANASTELMSEKVSIDNYKNGLPKSAWYWDNAYKFTGRILLTAYQFDGRDVAAPGPYLATVDGDIDESLFGKLVVICIDKNKEYKIFDAPYRKINSITLFN